jgi:flagellar hook assembly protein FlgD
VIRNAGGAVVKSFSKSAGCAVGGTVTSTAWDGRNAARALVPPGTYTIDVIVTDKAGNASTAARGTVVAQ